MRTLFIDERELTTERALHQRLKRDLCFPGYYGENLAALGDCLEDISQPVRIAIRRAGAPCTWFDGFLRVFERSAQQNPFLEVAIEGADETQALLHEILAVLQSAASAAEGTSPMETGEVRAGTNRETTRNLATGSDGDRFECSECGCRISDLLEESRLLLDGIPFCPHCGREVANPGGSESMKWISELI